MSIIYFLANALLAFGAPTRDVTNLGNQNSIPERSVASSYFHQLYYWPSNAFVGYSECCMIGSYCIISNVGHHTYNGFEDLLTAEFTPTTRYSVPYASISGAHTPNDYVVVTGAECYDATVMTPSNSSTYYFDFLQFYQAAQ